MFLLAMVDDPHCHSRQCDCHCHRLSLVSRVAKEEEEEEEERKAGSENGQTYIPSGIKSRRKDPT